MHEQPEQRGPHGGQYPDDKKSCCQTVLPTWGGAHHRGTTLLWDPTNWKHLVRGLQLQGPKQNCSAVLQILPGEALLIHGTGDSLSLAWCRTDSSMFVSLASKHQWQVSLHHLALQM